jgi:zinc D-Ala-D-Ala carboxypeptidase
MNLSPHFTFEELTRTGQTALQDKNRQEAQAFIKPLTELAELLEVIRTHFGKPLKINSGFRGLSVNTGTPGSSKTSQHMKGEAADIEIPGVDDAELHRWIVKDSGLKFGQCILERPPGRSWVHVSICGTRDPKRCNEALTFDGTSYKPYKG